MILRFHFFFWPWSCFVLVFSRSQGHMITRYSQEAPSMGQHSCHGCIIWPDSYDSWFEVAQSQNAILCSFLEMQKMAPPAILRISIYYMALQGLSRVFIISWLSLEPGSYYKTMCNVQQGICWKRPLWLKIKSLSWSLHICISK